jgi:flagellin-like protein
MKRGKSTKAISPVIATVLLVGMVVVVGLIVFLWFRGFIEEAGIKFGKNVELVCDDVFFDGSYSGGYLSIRNTGNVPIYEMRMKENRGAEGYSTDKIEKGWPIGGLNQGGVFSEEISFSGVEDITLMPVLMGEIESGKKSFECGERYGYKINL